MEFRTLGRTNQRVSVISLGSGGANRLGQASQADRADVHRFVRYALDLGLNLIDTAPGYDDSESLLGEALDGVARDSYILCTKFGARGSEHQPGALRASLEASLRKLRTDVVDVMFLHGISPTTYDLHMSYVDELRQAQQDGLTRWLGVTEVYERDPGHTALQQALTSDVFDVMMVGHNLVTPGGLSGFLPAAARHNVGLLVMCAVRTVLTNPQLLTETIREWKDEGALPEDAVPDDRPLDWVLGPGVETIADAAYKFAIESPAVSTVLTGPPTGSIWMPTSRRCSGPVAGRDQSAAAGQFTPANRSVIMPGARRALRM